MKSIAFVTILLLSSSISSAQAPDLGPDPVELEADEAAPFAGVLMTTARVAVLSQRAASAQRNTALAVTGIAQLMQVDIDKAKRDLEIEKELAEEKERLWRDRLDAVEPWYERPIVVGPSSVVLFALAIYVARETIIEVH